MADWGKKRTLMGDTYMGDSNVRLSKVRSFKDKPAPQPPSGFSPLPKIGNYKPKSLLTPDHGGPVAHSAAREPEVKQSYIPRSDTNAPEVGRLNSKPLIIGDKDTPLQIESQKENELVNIERPAAQGKKRAPAPPTSNKHSRSDSVIPNSTEETAVTTNPYTTEETAVTTNPYTTGETAVTTNPLFDTFNEEDGVSPSESQEGIIDFGPGLNEEPSITKDSKYLNGSSPRELPDLPTDLPYIPPPDYDDEELTMDFDEEVGDMNKKNNRLSLYKDYEGDDFGQYLKDDEYGFDSHGGQWRPPRNGHPSGSHHRNDKRFSKPNKHNKKSDQGRNTIRNFGYTDSKIGWGDRTVKSTSAKGRYIKREKGRKRIDMDPKGSLKSGPDYEEFLRNRNGLLPESPQSSDSGLGEGDDVMRNSQTYYNSQPKQMNKGEGTMSSMWKRLTWRFKRNVSVSKYNHR